jgi:hypothetical protein
MRRFLLPVAAFIVYGSLYPFHFDFARTTVNPFLFLLRAWPVALDRFALRDAASICCCTSLLAPPRISR